MCIILRQPYKTTQDCRKSAKPCKTKQNHMKTTQKSRRNYAKPRENYAKPHKTRNYAKLKQCATMHNHVKPCETTENHVKPRGIYLDLFYWKIAGYKVAPKMGYM